MHCQVIHHKGKVANQGNAGVQPISVHSIVLAIPHLRGLVSLTQRFDGARFTALQAVQ